ncbi:unnamed protein product [Parnassius mnemosyne]|uniref:Uncharacterized protein n=1 Tax=Parnassius mnemosyne TaxID=213953 RepID=A0AAV1LMV4_9NEOP
MRTIIRDILQNDIVNSQDSDDNNDEIITYELNCTTPNVSEAPKAAKVLNVFVHSSLVFVMLMLNKNQKQPKITDILH